MLTKAEIINALERMPNQERLEIIEVASRLVRQDKLAALARSAEIMKPLYEAGGELTETTDFY
jgi:acyl-CoA reductase-like NAD-dependent aldehyde dehydrogenase